MSGPAIDLAKETVRPAKGRMSSTRLDVPQIFPRLESDALALGDVHAGTCLDVSAHAALAGPWFEHAEALGHRPELTRYVLQRIMGQF